MEHGLRTLSVYVKGPLGRESALRALASTGSRSRHPRLTPSPQRLPAPSGASLREIDVNGELFGPRLPALSREDMKLFLKGTAATPTSAATSGALTPRPARPGSARKLSNYGSQLREKQKVKRLYGWPSDSSAATTTRRSA